MNCKKNAKSRSDDEHRLFDPAVEKVVELGLERLRPFENHPFKVKEDEAMARLIYAVGSFGITGKTHESTESGKAAESAEDQRNFKRDQEDGYEQSDF